MRRVPFWVSLVSLHLMVPRGGINKSDVGGILAAARGSSGSTCHSMLAWLKAQQPPVHLWENVIDLIGAVNYANLSWLLSQLFQIGYICSYGGFRSSHYGHPTKRERAYGICINFKAMNITVQEATALAQRIVMFVETNMKVAVPLRLSTFLLGDSDEHVRWHTDNQHIIKSANLEKKSEDLQWRRRTQQACDAANLNYSKLKPSPLVAKVPYYKNLPLREQHAIMVHLSKHNKDIEVTNMDTSQCITRMRLSCDPILETVTPEGRVVLFPPLVGAFRGLTGIESARIAGIPLEFMQTFLESPDNMLNRAEVDRLMYNLAGNAFSGGVALSFVIAILLFVDPKHLMPKKTEGTPNDDVDVMSMTF